MSLTTRVCVPSEEVRCGVSAHVPRMERRQGYRRGGVCDKSRAVLLSRAALSRQPIPYRIALAPHSISHLSALPYCPHPTLPCGVTERGSLREQESVFQEVLLVDLNSVLCDELAILVLERLALMVCLLIAYVVHDSGFLFKGVGERSIFF